VHRALTPSGFLAPSRLCHYISKALEHAPPTHTLEDVLDGIARGEFQCWHGDGSVVVTMIQVYPRSKILAVWLASGTLGELQQMLPDILSWAREERCDSAFIAGRHGFARSFLVREGWDVTQLILEKRL